MGTAHILSWTGAAPSLEQRQSYTLSGAGMWREEIKWLPTYGLLVAYFAVILALVLMSRELMS